MTRVEDDLQRLLARVTADVDVSPARARQLRWVAGELTTALGHRGFPTTTSLAELFSDPYVAAYLGVAERGELRRRATSSPGAASPASMRVRADCLRLLAWAAGLPEPDATREPPPEPREVVPKSQQHHWRQLLQRRGGLPNAPDGQVRMLAILGVVLDTGARAGELTAVRLGDLDEDLATVRLDRRPQARSASPVRTETVPLSAPTRTALRRWLTVREALVAGLQGTTDALWVSLRPNHAGLPRADGTPITRPAGLPLMPRGLARAYTRAVEEANTLLAGEPRWTPLPKRLEQLRRAVEAG